MLTDRLLLDAMRGVQSVEAVCRAAGGTAARVGARGAEGDVPAIGRDGPPDGPALGLRAGRRHVDAGRRPSLEVVGEDVIRVVGVTHDEVVGKRCEQHVAPVR